MAAPAPPPPGGWPTTLPTGGPPAWISLAKDQNANLVKCAASSKTAGELASKNLPDAAEGYLVRFVAPTAWSATATGSAVCVQMDAGQCEAVQDWTCSMTLRPCTDTVEGSRMVLCSEGSPADNWGWTLVIVLAVCAVMYAGIGIGYGVKVGGAPPGIAAHPHIDLWSQISGLVADGAAYAHARVTAKGGAQGGLREPLAATPPAAAEVDEGEEGTAAVNAGSSGSAEEASSDDELVE
jgi:hypothetical protein